MQTMQRAGGCAPHRFAAPIEVCYDCGETLTPDERASGAVCGACHEIRMGDAPRCAECGSAMAYTDSHRRCEDCRRIGRMARRSRGF